MLAKIYLFPGRNIKITRSHIDQIQSIERDTQRRTRIINSKIRLMTRREELCLDLFNVYSDINQTGKKTGYLKDILKKFEEEKNG